MRDLERLRAGVRDRERSRAGVRDRERLRERARELYVEGRRGGGGVVQLGANVGMWTTSATCAEVEQHFG